MFAMTAEDPRIATLEWIPRSVRTRMDEAGVRISLAQWQAMALGDRRALADAAPDAGISLAHFESMLALGLARAGS
jgi:hypothetical protein